jgi:cytosine/uracil/thiamine/allantoin permease
MSEKEKQKEEKSPLEKRLDAIGWGLFLIMIGGLWLAPEHIFPEGTWLIGTGVIILGLSLIRYMNQIRVSGFMVFLGVLALGSGLGDVFGLDLPVFPILLIIFGAAMILKPFFDKKLKDQ